MKWFELQNEVAGIRNKFIGFFSIYILTGPTSGIITLPFAKDMNFLNQTQLSIAMVSVTLSAIIPALIAKKFILNERFFWKHDSFNYSYASIIINHDIWQKNEDCRSRLT
jgi:hypothetical protein